MSSKPKTIRLIKYTVRGSSSFPKDMLRYDQSTPATEEDAKLIEFASDWRRNLRDEPVELMLATYVPAWVRRDVVKAGLIPCVGRWRSFGWEVTEVYPTERIPYAEVPREELIRMTYEEEN